LFSRSRSLRPYSDNSGPCRRHEDDVTPAIRENMAFFRHRSGAEPGPKHLINPHMLLFFKRYDIQLSLYTSKFF
jgi:hypothetical protein